MLDIKIEADSVDTGSGMKNGKLKSKKFFDAKRESVHHFSLHENCANRSKYLREADGILTICGVSNPGKLTLTLPADATGFEHIDGKMVFDRKDYGMNSGIPFVTLPDHVEVTIALERVKSATLPSFSSDSP